MISILELLICMYVRTVIIWVIETKQSSEMIKCEVVFDGDLIYCKGKLISFQQGAFKDYWEIENVGEIFDTQEQAIKYCMENNE